MKFAVIVADSCRKVAIPPKLNLKLKSESEAKSHHVAGIPTKRSAITLSNLLAYVFNSFAHFGGNPFILILIAALFIVESDCISGLISAGCL